MPKDYPFETIEVILDFDSGPLAGKLFDALPLTVLPETNSREWGNRAPQQPEAKKPHPNAPSSEQ